MPLKQAHSQAASSSPSSPTIEQQLATIATSLNQLTETVTQEKQEHEATPSVHKTVELVLQEQREPTTPLHKSNLPLKPPNSARPLRPEDIGFFNPKHIQQVDKEEKFPIYNDVFVFTDQLFHFKQTRGPDQVYKVLPLCL
jgi:hypothetical protein